MAETQEHHDFRQSLLRRLLDEDPEAVVDRTKSRTEELREFHESVRGDMEDLLNSRQPCLVWPSWLDELSVSLVNYGIPDFTGYDIASPERREEFRRTVEEVVRNFEPRLMGVSVSLVTIDDATRSIRFRINALIQADPAPEAIIFDSVVNTATRTFAVIGDDHG
ncbi:MAG: type VI secretion system baseplate subunit TssE [Stellaceae bacterium]